MLCRLDKRHRALTNGLARRGTEIRIKAGRNLETLNVRTDDLLAEHIQVEIVGVVAERLLDFFSGSEEAKVNERGDGHSGDGVPLELFDQLEGKEEKVNPDRVPNMNRVDEGQRRSQDLLQGTHTILECSDSSKDTAKTSSRNGISFLQNTAPLRQTPENLHGQILPHIAGLREMLLVNSCGVNRARPFPERWAGVFNEDRLLLPSEKVPDRAEEACEGHEGPVNVVHDVMALRLGSWEKGLVLAGGGVRGGAALERVSEGRRRCGVGRVEGAIDVERRVGVV